jgi:hypothetical protein
VRVFGASSVGPNPARRFCSKARVSLRASRAPKTGARVRSAWRRKSGRMSSPGVLRPLHFLQGPVAGLPRRGLEVGGAHVGLQRSAPLQERRFGPRGLIHRADHRAPAGEGDERELVPLEPVSGLRPASSPGQSPPPSGGVPQAAHASGRACPHGAALRDA